MMKASRPRSTEIGILSCFLQLKVVVQILLILSMLILLLVILILCILIVLNPMVLDHIAKLWAVIHQLKG
jgi:uncharacterized BrkB/YihY/UPF0761 family membrane protein